MTPAWADPDRSDAHEVEHVDCEAPFYCMACERAVCPRCEDGPGAPSYCPECDWKRGASVIARMEDLAAEADAGGDHPTAARIRAALYDEESA